MLTPLVITLFVAAVTVAFVLGDLVMEANAWGREARAARLATERARTRGR